MSQIPEISDIFNKTTLKMSNIAKRVPNTKEDFEMYCKDFKQIAQRKEISEEYGIHVTYDDRINILHIGFNMKGKEKIAHDDAIKNNLFYADLLKNYKNKYEENKKFYGNTYVDDYNNYICLMENGDLMKPGFLSQKFSEILDKNNLRHIRLHDLRHSCRYIACKKWCTFKRHTNMVRTL